MGQSKLIIFIFLIPVFIFPTVKIYSAEKSPKVFIRFKILEPNKAVYCKLSSLRRLTRPYRVTFTRPIPRSGVKYPKRWIKPREYSPWIDVTKLLEKKRRTDIFAASTVHLTFFSEKPLAKVKALIDVSTTKDDTGIVKTITENAVGTNEIGILIPWDVKNMPDKIETITENVKKRHAYIKEVKKELKLDGKKLPEKIIIEANCKAWNAGNIVKMEKELLEDMGFNSIISIPGGYKLDKKHLDPKNRMVWGGCDNPPKFDDVIKSSFYKLPEKAGNIYSIIMRDEPATSLNGKGHVYNCKDCEKAFIKYLQKEGVEPSFFGKNDWKDIKPTRRGDENADLNSRKLHYYTVKFANSSTTGVFRRMKELLHERFKDKKVLATTNFADHPFLKKGIKDGAVDIFDLGRGKGVDLLWTEDWLSSFGWFTVTNELSSYLGALLRASAKYDNLPIGFYATQGSGIATRQKTYSMLSQGAKYIHYYDYGPRYAKTDYGFWSHDKDRAKSVCKLTREIAQVEDVLYSAMPRPAKTAILYSHSSDIWEKGSEPFILERRYIFLALMHDQVPVDFMTENDIIDGYLKNYKVLYLIGPNIMKKAAENIKKWVKNGGTLCVDAGSAIRDEFNSENKLLYDVMGISLCNPEIVKWRYSSGGRDGRIMKLPSSGTVQTVKSELLDSVAMDALGCHQNVIPVSGAKVLGSFETGAPGIILNKYGKGNCLLFNSLPGLAYIKGSNFTGKDYTTEYPDGIRSLITAPVRFAKIAKPVKLSHPIIEATLLEAAQVPFTGGSSSGKKTATETVDNEKIVILNNYAMKPVEKLTVTLRDIGDFNSITSLEHGKLKYKKNKNEIIFSMPFGASDMITIK